MKNNKLIITLVIILSLILKGYIFYDKILNNNNQIQINKNFYKKDNHIVLNNEETKRNNSKKNSFKKSDTKSTATIFSKTENNEYHKQQETIKNSDYLNDIYTMCDEENYIVTNTSKDDKTYHLIIWIK